MRVGSAPLAPRWEASRPPNPLQVMLAAQSPHWCKPPLYQNRLAPLAGLIYPISMRVKRLACRFIESGLTGAGYPLGALGPGVQGARPPLAARRAGELSRSADRNSGSKGAVPGEVLGDWPSTARCAGELSRSEDRNRAGGPGVLPATPRRHMILLFRHRQEDFALRNQRLNHIRRRIIVAIAGLAGFDRAATGAEQCDGVTRQRADPTGAESDRQTR